MMKVKDLLKVLTWKLQHQHITVNNKILKVCLLVITWPKIGYEIGHEKVLA